VWQLRFNPAAWDEFTTAQRRGHPRGPGKIGLAESVEDAAAIFEEQGDNVKAVDKAARRIAAQ
jgi:hypothetical protein